MGEFRHGFKSWCEGMAGGYRRDLKIHPHAALPPKLLADDLGIKVVTPDEIPSFAKKHRDQLLVHDEESWSAVTLTLPGARIIIQNSAHAPTRRNSDVMHELAHIILKHEPTQVMLSSNGHMFMDNYDKQQELEADWLGASLLVPRDGLLALLSRNADVAAAATHFAVSAQMVQWRLRKTGVERPLGYRAQSLVGQHDHHPVGRLVGGNRDSRPFDLGRSERDQRGVVICVRPMSARARLIA